MPPNHYTMKQNTRLRYIRKNRAGTVPLGDGMEGQELIRWFENSVRGFLERNAKERLPALEDDCERLKRLLTEPGPITVCFLGHSGVGKSTLLNALVADDRQILPAGGTGPLTAQATEVHYAAVSEFSAFYQKKKSLWQVGFVLERQLMRLVSKRSLSGDPVDVQGANTPLTDRLLGSFSGLLDQETLDKMDVEADYGPTEEDVATPDRPDALRNQASLIITGNQFTTKPLSYLVDGLRFACGLELRSQTVFDPEDQRRLDRVYKILSEAGEGGPYRRELDGDVPYFQEDLKAHVAGFLSPLIERIEVGWPSDLLKGGVHLVDLPGLGIAQDSYRDITKHYVRDRARAIVVVVDRAGPTESTVDLLRSSGYWSRLVGSADDPESDPCSMIIAVTRVDDVACEEWQRRRDQADGPRPSKGEVYMGLVQEFRDQMRRQITEQLDNMIGKSDDDRAQGNQSVQNARDQAKRTILESLEIHPVSAPELRKIIRHDEEDRAFLKEDEDTGIPTLRRILSKLPVDAHRKRQVQIREVFTRFSASIMSELIVIEKRWQEGTQATEAVAALSQALEKILEPKKNEYFSRLGAFRSFLEETVPEKIGRLVLEASKAAEEDIRRYLGSLQHVHWRTLQAAVKYGGTFDGARRIDLPDDIATYFQEPMAAVWGQQLLRDIRRQTRDFSKDIAEMVAFLCAWGVKNAGAHVASAVLEAQCSRVEGQAAQMAQVGREAVDDLRNHVKTALLDVIRKPIRKACQQFVVSGSNAGRGVRDRILDLFADLATQATRSAQIPATDVLRNNFGEVREEIRGAFERWGNPIEETGALIVEREEQRRRRADAQRRGRVLGEHAEVLAAQPTSGDSRPVGHT